MTAIGARIRRLAAAALALGAGSAGADSRRFFGHGGSLGDAFVFPDRVKVPSEPPAAVSVGAGNFTIEFFLRAAAADNANGGQACGFGIAWLEQWHHVAVERRALDGRLRARCPGTAAAPTAGRLRELRELGSLPGVRRREARLSGYQLLALARRDPVVGHALRYLAPFAPPAGPEWSSDSPFGAGAVPGVGWQGGALLLAALAGYAAFARSRR